MFPRPQLLILAAGLAFHLQALEPSLSISQYHKQYWQVEQGLPHSYVAQIQLAPDGYLLIGTAEGLARFDGVSFYPFQAEPSLRLSQRWISALLSARDGSLWVGTFDDGTVVQFRNGRVVSQYRAGGSVFDLVEDAQGTIWASTRNGLLRCQSGALVKQPGLRPPLETSWNVLAVDTSATLWVATADGLFQRRGDSFTLRLPNTAGYGDVLTVGPSRSGGLWLGTSTGLFRFGSTLTKIPGIPGPIVSILEDKDGVLWASCWGKGLYRIQGGRVDHWSSAQGLPDDSIRTLAEDNEGNLWIGMRSGGLGCWRDTPIVPLGAPEGLAGNYASIVANGPDRSLWLATWRSGLYRLSNGSLQSLPVPLPTIYFTARALAFDRQGHAWIGNWEGLLEFDGRAYHRYASEPDSPYGRVSALLFDKSGALWVGTAGRGLYRFPQGRPTSPPPPALLNDSEITALLEGADGVVWVGTSSGLRRIPSPGASPEVLPAFPADTIHSLFEDSKRRIWAAATGALFVITPSARRILDHRQGLPEHSLYRVLEDAEGGFWVSSPRGIFELKAASVERVLAGTSQELAVVPYNQDDGMRTIECHGLSQPAGSRAPDGSLWFPTARGFIQIRPSRRRLLPAPRVAIEEVSAGWGRAALSNPVDLPPGTRNLEVRFTALRFSAPGKMQFRYRMNGFDPDWVAAGTRRTARYNQLPPGPHVFEVQAHDPGGEWGASATIAFQQQPLFHQTWWFHGLVSLAVLAVFGALYSWRLHAVHGRYAAVLEERNRIGREWHDTLVAGFSAISLQIEAALASIATRPERSSDILEMTRRMVHHYRAEARRVIWDLRDNRPDGETLPMAVEEALHRVIEHRGIQGAVTVEGPAVELAVDLQLNVLRICQEAISNSARHAHPARIDVQLIFSPSSLKAVVRDNGCGFPTEAAAVETAGHFGLTVMQERAHRHGGCLRIESHPGLGTTVETTIPLAGAAR
jgi:signal transduction histidine kinase/ligand-binding sensor domain-containing protein